MLRDAIAHYHDLLTDAMAAASQEHIESQQRVRSLYFGVRPICTVLRPRFLTAAQFRFLQERVAILLSAFAKTQTAALADAGFRRQFRLTEDEEKLVTIDCGMRCAYPTSRLDAFFVSEQELRFTEYNSETPAGAAYCDVLTDVFYGAPILRAFARRYRLIPNLGRPGILHTLLDAYEEWCRRREPPRVAIVDWREVPTFNEFILWEKFFHNQGIECVIADPRELEYRGGRLWAGNFHVTLIYKRVLIGELLERGGLSHPLVKAVRDRAVCMVNPFPCKILYKKASFAAVTDERNGHLFDDAERRAIADHIPWTRLVEERKTTFQRQEVDLIPFIHQHRDRLVLKPNDDYGGKGIVLGWTVGEREWEQAVRTALHEPYVVQERINIPSEPYPSYIDGHVQIFDRLLDTDPYVSYGEFMDACMTRLSTAALLNVTAGGGSAVPTFVIEKR